MLHSFEATTILTLPLTHCTVVLFCLQAVGHSLGAACLLVYAVVSRMQGQPHRLRRLILMSPAGFHSHVPLVSLLY